MIVEKQITVPVQVVYCDVCPESDRKESVNGKTGCYFCGRHVCQSHAVGTALPDAGDPDWRVILCQTCYSVSLVWFEKWTEENERHEQAVKEIRELWMQAISLSRTKQT